MEKADILGQPKTLVKSDSAVTVNINGFEYDVPRGEPVEVPIQVADALEDGGYLVDIDERDVRVFKED